MFLGFMNTKICGNHKSLSLYRHPLLFYQPFLSLWKNVPSSTFWRVSKTPIPIAFVKWVRSNYNQSKLLMSHIPYYKKASSNKYI